MPTPETGARSMGQPRHHDRPGEYRAAVLDIAERAAAGQITQE